MTIKITQKGFNLYTAEVTLPHADGGPWRTPYPMGIAELFSTLKSLGCDIKEIDAAYFTGFLEWSNQHYRKWAEEASPGLIEALDGKREVPRQGPFYEAW